MPDEAGTTGAPSGAAEVSEARSPVRLARRYDGPRPRPETLSLFGCRLADMRSEACLSLEAFAEGAHRSTEWVRSVERGQCALSNEGFMGLKLGFFRNHATEKYVDLIGLYKHLDEEPLGEEARRLRERHNIDIPQSERLGQDPDGLIPILHDIAYQDRLLTVTPLVLAVGFGLTLYSGRPWRGNGFDFAGLDLGVLTFFALVAVACLALIMPATSGFLTGLAIATRSKNVREYRFEAAAIRNDEGAVADNGRSWHIVGEGLFSVPSHWGDLRQTSLHADFFERLIAITVGGLSVLSVALVLAVEGSRAPGSWLPWATLLLMLGVALRLLFARRSEYAAAVPGLIAECYGVQPREDAPDPGDLERKLATE